MRPSGTFSSPSWSSLDEQDPLTPLAVATRQLEVITPGTAAAATWTDPSAPGYFPAGLSSDHKRRNRSLRKKAARAPLPRLISGEVVSSPAAESDSHFGDPLFNKHEPHRLGLHDSLDSDLEHKDRDRSASPSGTYALRRSAQSLALSLRFKMLRAKRKVKKTGQGAAELFTPGHASQRSSIEGASLSV